MSFRLPLIYTVTLALFTGLLSAPSFAIVPITYDPGYYTGVFSGPVSGTFELTLTDLGVVNGSAYDTLYGTSAPFAGTVGADGAFTDLTVVGLPTSLPATGQFSADTVSGTFEYDGGVGSFAGTLQAAPEMNSAAAFGLIALMAGSLALIGRRRSAATISKTSV